MQLELNFTNLLKDTLKNSFTMKGLGDLVAKVFKFFYIDVLVEKIAHLLGYEYCGCTRRKNTLNKLFPFKKKK